MVEEIEAHILKRYELLNKQGKIIEYRKFYYFGHKTIISKNIIKIKFPKEVDHIHLNSLFLIFS